MWHLRYWLQYWQLRTCIHDNICYLSINCDTGQHSQFLRCLYENRKGAWKVKFKIETRFWMIYSSDVVCFYIHPNRRKLPNKDLFCHLCKYFCSIPPRRRIYNIKIFILISVIVQIALWAHFSCINKYQETVYLIFRHLDIKIYYIIGVSWYIKVIYRNLWTLPPPKTALTLVLPGRIFGYVGLLSCFLAIVFFLHPENSLVLIT